MRKDIVLRKMLLGVLAICLSIVLLTCHRREAKEATVAVAGTNFPGFDVQKINEASGVKFRILKYEDIGDRTIQRFLWILVSKKTEDKKLQELATRIIDATIAALPNTYTGLTLHFFEEAAFAGTPGKSKPFAKATFFPEGNEEKVGRAPIDHYQGYQMKVLIY